MAETVRKYSRQREAIRANLKNRCDHPTADMVYSDIQKICPNISLGTVYRNLALLSDDGEIIRLFPMDGAVRYDGNIAPHDHFFCKCCGSIQDLENYRTDSMPEAVKVRVRGKIESYTINYYGICDDCLSRNAE